MYHGNRCTTRWLLNNEDDGTDEYQRRHEETYGYDRLIEEENNDDSTCSSMPSLVSVTSEEYDCKMDFVNDEISTESSSSNSSSQRIRNSYDLCGNN